MTVRLTSSGNNDDGSSRIASFLPSRRTVASSVGTFLLVILFIGSSRSQFRISTLSFSSTEVRKPALSSLLPHDDWWLYRGSRDNGNLSHPHLGARHPNGSIGMVLYPSPLRLRHPIITPLSMMEHTFNHSSSGNARNDFLCPIGNNTFGIESEGGNKVMHKIRRGLQEARQWLQSATALPGKPVRILCMIYTVQTDRTNHSSLAAIADTWGRQCDGFFGASNFSDHSIGAIDLLHQGPEAYGNMWQKIRSMWTYAYDHYLHDYDYFYIGGDDMYVLVDHMRLFFQSDKVQKLEHGQLDRIAQYYADQGHNTTEHLRPRPLVFATPMMFDDIPVFAGGGGYALNRAALQMWGEQGADSFHADLWHSIEDVLMGRFFFHRGVYISDTQDEDGCWRFDSSAEDIYYFDGKSGWINPPLLHSRFGFHIGVGYDSGSKYHMTFHLKSAVYRVAGAGYTPWDVIRRYHAFFHSWCPNDVETQENVDDDKEQ